MKTDTFIKRLLAVPRKRVPLEMVTSVFLEVFTEYEDHPNFREPLSKVLDALADQGQLVLPKGKRLWDTVESPKLPVWIEIPSQDKGKAQTGSIAWLPELGPVAAQIKQRAQLEDLARINAYLIENRGKLLLVPFRERALKIFGDEHYLDQKIRKGRLFGGRLPLSAIYAVEANEPMPYERPLSMIKGRPILILENHHSFASFVKANAEQDAFSAICYASGNTFASRERSLDVIGEKLCTNRYLYLGDIDPRGLSIPIEVNAKRRERGAVLIEPASGFYTWLMENGTPGPMAKQQSPVSVAKLEDWFMPCKNIVQMISTLFSENKRLAQEYIGIEELSTLDMHALIS